MEEKIMKVETRKEETNLFITEDGKRFKNQDEALLHEEYLKLEVKVEKLKNVNGAYYCALQEDFDLVINYMSHNDIQWDFKQKKYVVSVNYSKSDFHGADWYFFKMQYNADAADDYWVESLSEKKKRFDEFYGQFYT